MAAVKTYILIQYNKITTSIAWLHFQSLSMGTICVSNKHLLQIPKTDSQEIPPILNMLYDMMCVC